MHEVKFSYTKPHGDRRHYINEFDVRVILRRLPYELWQTLKAVYLNDRSGGANRLGYVNQGRREIAICAQPQRTSMKWAPSAGEPEQYGAVKGAQWPTLAVRRYQLYYTFLHELGHLQIVHPERSQRRRKYALEKEAHLFANHWRKKLWAEKFNHRDPVHNRPTKEESDLIQRCWVKAHFLFKKGLRVENPKDFSKCLDYFHQAIEIYPNHTQALERIGMLTYEQNESNGSTEALRQAEAWLQHALSIDPLLPHAGKYLELVRRRLTE
jgi:hypothetical protein